MNNIFKKLERVDIDDSHYLVTDNFRGVCLVHHYPAKRKNKEGEVTEYTAMERFYYPTVFQALEKYVFLKQIILPTIAEMAEVQKEVASVLKEFKTKYKNWD